MPRAAPKPDRRRALRLLADNRNGCTEAMMLVHGFRVELLADLCIAIEFPPFSFWKGARLYDFACMNECLRK
jgi:hypothetical protein